MEKHSESRLSYLVAHLYLLSSDSFSSTLLSSNLSLLSASSLLCFSSVHIVGSLTSKLPSINITELQAFVTKESRIANPFPASRILFGLDSQVSLGAVVKGSPALNRVLQHGICFAIGGDVPCTTTLPPTELTIRHVVQHQSRQTLTCPAGFPNLNGLRQLGHLRLEQNCLLKTFAEGKTWTFALQLR